MTWRRYAISALLCTLLGLCTAQAPLHAQETPADTAAILVSVARGLDIEGRRDLAEELLRYVMEHYPGTAAAQEAQQLLEALVGIRQAGSGRVQFVVWNTVFAIWLGLAVPAAFGADEPEPFGAGLLLAGPSGFLVSRGVHAQPSHYLWTGRGLHARHCVGDISGARLAFGIGHRRGGILRLVRLLHVNL